MPYPVIGVKYYLGPRIWKDAGVDGVPVTGWYQPEGVIGSLDLRSVPTQAQAEDQGEWPHSFFDRYCDPLGHVAFPCSMLQNVLDMVRDWFIHPLALLAAFLLSIASENSSSMSKNSLWRSSALSLSDALGAICGRRRVRCRCCGLHV